MEKEHKLTHRRSFPVTYSDEPDIAYQFFKTNIAFSNHRRSVPGTTSSGASSSFVQFSPSVNSISDRDKNSKRTSFLNHNNDFTSSAMYVKDDDSFTSKSFDNTEESHCNKRVNFAFKNAVVSSEMSSASSSSERTCPEQSDSLTSSPLNDTTNAQTFKSELDCSSSNIAQAKNSVYTNAALNASALTTTSDDGTCLDKSPNGRFIKMNEVGRGAFKTVYKGLDTDDGVAVAWCELQDFYDKEERARFREEAKMLKELQHPNIVRFYDYWEENRKGRKVIVLITELMTSGSLKSYLRNFQGELNKKKLKIIKNWCRQILNGLSFLHDKNPPVIHRDLKCDNIFITGTTGCVKIGDLGLAVLKTETFAKSMRGTMEFMAPEMFDEMYDEMVDVYAFGLCMLEMATGEYPYIECKFPTAVMKKVMSGAKPACFYKVKDDSVREVIECCIQKNKSERLTAAELLQHSFFMEDNGLRIDLVKDSEGKVPLHRDFVEMKIKVVDQSKRKFIHEQGDALIFRFDLNKDVPENISYELVEKNFITKEDVPFVTKSLRDRIRSFHYLCADELNESLTASHNNSTFKGSNLAMTSAAQNIPVKEDEKIQQAAVIAANVKNLNRFIVVNHDLPSCTENSGDYQISESVNTSPIPNGDNKQLFADNETQSVDAFTQNNDNGVFQGSDVDRSQNDFKDASKNDVKSDTKRLSESDGKQSKNEDFAKHKLAITVSCIKGLKEIANTIADVLSANENPVSLIGRTFVQEMYENVLVPSGDHVYESGSILNEPSAFVLISRPGAKKNYDFELKRLNQDLKLTLSKSEKEHHDVNLCDVSTQKLSDDFDLPADSLKMTNHSTQNVTDVKPQSHQPTDDVLMSVDFFDPNCCRRKCSKNPCRIHSDCLETPSLEPHKKRLTRILPKVHYCTAESECCRPNDSFFYKNLFKDSLENRLSALLMRQQQEITALIARHQLEIHSFFCQFHQTECPSENSECCNLLASLPSEPVVIHPCSCRHHHCHMNLRSHQFSDGKS